MKKFLFMMLFFSALNANELFVVGTTSGYAPFVSLNDQGEYEGFDIDVARAVSAKIKRPIQFKDYGNMPGLMLAVKQNKVDAMIWAISITQERKANFNLVYYQGDRVDTIPLVFWGEIPKGVETLADLAKKKVSVEAGSYQEGIMKTYPGISLKYFDGVQGAILDLKYGKSLASSIDPALLPRFMKRYPELRVLEVSLPEEMRSEGNGICLNLRSEALTAQVKKAVAQLREEGVILELERKWGLR